MNADNLSDNGNNQMEWRRDLWALLYYDIGDNEGFALSSSFYPPNIEQSWNLAIKRRIWHVKFPTNDQQNIRIQS